MLSFVTNNLTYAIPIGFVLLIITLKILKNIRDIMIIVPEGYEVILEKFGSFDKVLQAGVHFVIPFMRKKKIVKWTREEESRYSGRSRNELRTYTLDKIPTNEQLFDFPEYSAITKDNLKIQINGMLIYKIVDTRKACYAISDLYLSFHKLIETSLRSCSSKMDILSVIHKKNEVERKVKEDLLFIEKSWGIKILKLDIQEVVPPNEFVSTNQNKWKQQNDLEIKILQEERERERQIQTQKTKTRIMELENERKMKKELHDKKVKEMKAEAEFYEKAKKVEFITQMLKAGVDQKYLETLAYVEAWKEVAKLNPNSTYVIPYESSKFFGMSKALVKNTE